MLGPADAQPGDALAAGKPTRYADLMTPAGLQDIAGYAEIIGPWTRLLIPVAEDGTWETPTALMADARTAGLQVWPYTFRPENHFLPAALREGDDPRTRSEAGSLAEIRAHLALGIGGFFDFLPRAFLLAGAIGMTVGVYQHINVRFNTPRWWRFIFNTVEHHSVHHSQDYEATRSNYSGTWIIWDRLFGTCVDGEAEVLGMEGGRRMHIGETMVFPFREGWRSIKAAISSPGEGAAYLSVGRLLKRQGHIAQIAFGFHQNQRAFF